jgi:Fic family protein
VEEEEIDPLLLIPAYVLDFLCIHPFLDGNGRMARLLSLLLLYKSGYEVGRYISLEQLVERTKESYYEALGRSSRHWHQGKHEIEPWWEYFLGVMLLPAYRELEARVGQVPEGRGAKTSLVKDVIERLPRVFRYRDVQQACPNVSRPTIQRAFKELKEEGRIRAVTAGRDATWERVESPQVGRSSRPDRPSRTGTTRRTRT